MNIEFYKGIYGLYDYRGRNYAKLTGLNANTKKIKVRIESVPNFNDDYTSEFVMPAFEGMKIFFGKMFDVFFKKVANKNFYEFDEPDPTEVLIYNVYTKTKLTFIELDEFDNVFGSREFNDIYPVNRISESRYLTRGKIEVFNALKDLQIKHGFAYKRMEGLPFTLHMLGMGKYVTKEDCKTIYNEAYGSGYNDRIDEYIIENGEWLMEEGRECVEMYRYASDSEPYYVFTGMVERMCEKPFLWVRWMAFPFGWKYGYLIKEKEVIKEKRLEGSRWEFERIIFDELGDAEKIVTAGRLFEDGWEKDWYSDLVGSPMVQVYGGGFWFNVRVTDEIKTERFYKRNFKSGMKVNFKFPVSV